MPGSFSGNDGDDHNGGVGDKDDVLHHTVAAIDAIV